MARTPSLSSCSSCGGFVPVRAEACPNCAKPAARTRSLATRLRVGAIGGALGGGAIAFTLMACYGCPDGSCGGGAYATGDGGRDLADAQIGADTGARDASSDAASASDAARGDGGDAGDAAADADAAP